jgi:hypothetical protein
VELLVQLANFGGALSRGERGVRRKVRALPAECGHEGKLN